MELSQKSYQALSFWEVFVSLYFVVWSCPESLCCKCKHQKEYANGNICAISLYVEPDLCS